MDQNTESVSVPKASDDLANGLSKLVLDVIAAKKAGATGVSLLTQAVSSAVVDLAGALGEVGQLKDEASADVYGVAEAFAIAGFKTARALKSA